ncbi:unnamed protein product [Paramecium pentaurelia]|uniref:Transmembrane protein n=1 Tax=Paramecium pentaurelia TaxID=43138 RepID=A0A8S1VEW0_9CILI|nr:unnamed protein product [Paramecium pentaurelia]
MNRKITLLILLACVVCVATFMFSFAPSDAELKLKKSHSFSASKNHEWGFDGYTSYDKECQKKCKDAKGMSCGKAQQNCCKNDQCVEEDNWYGTSLVCKARVPVEGCTKPK